MLYLPVWVSLLLLLMCLLFCSVLAPVWLVHKYLRCMGEELRIGTEENNLLHSYFWSLQRDVDESTPYVYNIFFQYFAEFRLSVP